MERCRKAFRDGDIAKTIVEGLRWCTAEAHRYNVVGVAAMVMIIRTTPVNDHVDDVIDSDVLSTSA